jgi:hypothetical protein
VKNERRKAQRFKFRKMQENLFARKFYLGAFCALFLILYAATGAHAQRRFSQTYPARRNIHIHLTNRTGTIEVVASERNNVRVTAFMETPSARCSPTVTDDGIEINILRDNMGREEMGDVNFRIEVPVESSVDLETKRGNITVRGVHGALVRARVSTEGDIELTGIRAVTVMASNTTGNILFDGDILRNGKYELNSMQGDINVRIPVNSGFRLIAVAREGRNIDLGVFGGMGDFNFTGDSSKRVVGKIGDGAASLMMTNHRGAIFFRPR